MDIRPLLHEFDANLLKSFERHLRAENKSARTIDHYRLAVRLLCYFAEDEGYPCLTELGRQHLESWLDALQQTHSEYSVNSYFRAVRVFFKWLVAEEEIKRSPLDRIKEPSFEEVPKDIVSPADMARVFAYLEKEKRWRDASLIAILYDTGVRATELADMKMDHVNLETGIILVPHTKAKRVRTVRIGPKAIRYIDRYHRKPRSDPAYLINGKRAKMTRSGILRAVKQVFAEVGIKGTIGAHDMRHTSASHMVTQLTESQLMSLYGWSSATMVRHYAKQALNDAAIEAHKKSSPMDNLPRL